jgi:tetratricopeptide (TPR) repeat protein
MVVAALIVPATALAYTTSVATPGPEAQLAAFAANPPAAGDVAARFGHASALAGVGRNDEAIAAFEALVADFPALPEPYNNLAALYAHAGDFEKARQVLERAMHTSSSYAAIYENLSAVYVEMARSSYVKALRMKEAPPAPSLQMLMTLERLPAPSVAATPPPVVATPVAPAEPVAALVAAALAASAPPVIEHPAVDTDAAALATLERWAMAWSAQDVDGYLAAYDEGFDPGDGLTRAVWAEQRRDRLGRPAWIKVELSDFEVDTAASSVVVLAKQHYSSNTYADRTLKRFELVERDGRWLIRAEQTLRAIP